MIDDLIARNDLPPSYRAIVNQYWTPLADLIAARPAPMIVGINGAQGSGKTTLCAFLEVLLAERGLTAATLSIDDLYLGKADRQKLAREIHPLFATRGVPGTHAPALGMAIFDAVKAGQSLDLPRFDKGTDDRRPAPQHVPGPVDVLLFEGWCVGCAPQADEELLDPVNALEAEEDPDGVWRSVSNLWLRGEYRDLFARLDLLVMLQVDGFDTVVANRRQQEDKLRMARPNAPGVMDEATLTRFCQHYERLTLHMLEDLPRRANVVIPIGPGQVPAGLVTQRR